MREEFGNRYYDSKIIAKYVLDYCESHRIYDVTNKKLNKLLYFICGIILANTGYCIFQESFTAWRNGPILASINLHFMHYGWEKISPADPIFNEPDIDDEEVKDWLHQACNFYANKDADWLKGVSMKRGSPWYQIFSKNPFGQEIPYDLIYNHFKKGIGN